jgi:hypothetical protein
MNGERMAAGAFQARRRQQTHTIAGPWSESNEPDRSWSRARLIDEHGQSAEARPKRAKKLSGR